MDKAERLGTGIVELSLSVQNFYLKFSFVCTWEKNVTFEL